VFACVFGSALLGMLTRAKLPEHHLSSETKDSVKLAMGLVATMVALILGLLIASAKSSYDSERNGVTQMAAKIVMLDRMLANYGPETKEPRELLRGSVERAVARMWPSKKSEQAQLDPSASRAEGLYVAIQQLSPTTELQTALKSQAMGAAIELGQMRWLEFEQAGGSVSMPILVIMTCWLAILFVSFGLFSPPNGTVVAALLLVAISVSAAIFLIMELDRPFDGLIQISSEPFDNSLAHLGQ
jgi:hypothetical protein